MLTQISNILISVFSPWCENYGDSGYLANCKETSKKVPLVHTVKVCNPEGSLDCRGPCYNCDQYCVPAKQSWSVIDYY